MENSINKQTLFDHFAGRTTSLQRSLLAEWLRHPDHQELYYRWLEEWEAAHLQYVADPDAALLKVRAPGQGGEEGREPVLPVGKQRFGSLRWLAAAALAGCLLTGLYRNRTAFLYKTEETAFGNLKKLTLPDGSKVVLNAHSSLRYPRFSLTGFGREVYLTGEADFSITHTPDHRPFRVRTARDFEVVVLGTEFTVYDRPKETRVVLHTGKVKINYPSGSEKHQLTLKPGDFVSLDKGGKLAYRKVARPRTFAAWKDHRYIFSETSLREIADLLKENYGLEVEIRGDTLARRTVSGSFRAETSEELLRVIANLLEISFDRIENRVTFYE
ncbi:FecR family protein [Larkinella soli]|uniref:FecR family protein n=1 Tax=Larkinella soli TaxID=1770527 RepID=UPI000FFC3E03|nr:FecR domain-containing protein [Larkinella soli]